MGGAEEARRNFFPFFSVLNVFTFFEEEGGAWGAPFTPGADPGRDGPVHPQNTWHSYQ